MVPSAYVHIPFCDSICAYCDFVRIQKNESFFSSWKEKLIQEIQEYKISSLHTLYFGGEDGYFTKWTNCRCPIYDCL